MRSLLLSISLLVFIGCKTHPGNDIQYPAGGYGFPKNITDSDFYFYPLIGTISRRDSFWHAYDEGYLFHLFKEDNISLSPAPEPIFRMAYEGNADCYIITLHTNEIVVKTGKGSYIRRIDGSKFTAAEKIHYRILQQYYPLEEKIPKEPVPPPPTAAMKQQETIYDSIKNNTAGLLNGEYYRYLIKKATIKNNAFSFTTSTIKITQEEFTNFVTLLNRSGYWQKPYAMTGYMVTHGFSFCLEANTGKKYHCAGFWGSCEPDTTLFHKACQQLVRMARLDDKIKISYY